MIRVKLMQKVGGWSVVARGHADEHVCLAASTLFSAVCAGIETLAAVYPDQLRTTFEDMTTSAEPIIAETLERQRRSDAARDGRSVCR